MVVGVIYINSFPIKILINTDLFRLFSTLKQRPQLFLGPFSKSFEGLE